MEIHRSLPELVYLLIFGCDQLEQIVLENEELENLSNGEVYFPKLEDIKIHSCRKMKSLFSVSMAKMLPKWSYLSIMHGDQLEEVFKHGHGDNTEIVLPNLEIIMLMNLPSFVDIGIDVKVKTPKLLPPGVSLCPKNFPNFGGIQKTIVSTNSQVRTQYLFLFKI